MSKKKDKKGGKRMNKSELSERLVNYLYTKVNESLTPKQIFRDLNLTTHPLKMLCSDIISEMMDDGLLTMTEKGQFKLNDHGLIMTGKFQRKSNGKNSFIPDDGSETIFIAERNSAHAMNNDKVKIALFAKKKNKEAEGEVIEILERANDTFVGTLKVDKYYAFLLTENRTLANDIFIPKDKLKSGKNGDKAVVKVIEWPDQAKNPIGQVIDILGQAGDNTTEMHAILAEFGLPYVYPKSVEEAADKIPTEITEEDLEGREDFRDAVTFTIDPKDAKDFDDALSIREIKSGLWEIGVHIADVTHYVKEGSIIDKEAEKRATSVYLVDRTIPMLPEKLSNGLCSLRPDEEKLTYSVIFTMNEKGEVKNSRITKTIIKSNRRFTYEEAQEIIETGKGDYSNELLELNKLAQILRAQRLSNGAIDFDRVEVRFEIDETGKPVSVYFKESKEANKLIEEFMLMANRSVAEYVGKVPKDKKAKVFPYRIHDLPDPDKLENLNFFINRFGYKIRTSGS
ncbi:RNB domain-containing ribonuclease, partial [Phocaeicola paurosaccharolyticus]|uniref:ribonuclease R family protein n=1 Tax=Phocaeicola paurosaccharolyticus TaxID=732242 RepID=UPI002FE3FC43